MEVAGTAVAAGDRAGTIEAARVVVGKDVEIDVLFGGAGEDVAFGVDALAPELDSGFFGDGDAGGFGIIPSVATRLHGDVVVGGSI